MKVETNKLRSISFFLYLIIFVFFVVRYFMIDLTLGYGLGDLVYVVIFSLWMLLSTLFYLLGKKKKTLSKITGVISILMSVYLILMMFAFTGAELGK